MGFHYIGLDPRIRVGVVQFYRLHRDKLQLCTQHLFCGPTEDLPPPPANQRGLTTFSKRTAPVAATPTATQEAMSAAMSAPCHLTLLTSDAAAAASLVDEAAALSRLLTRQGQWV